MRLALPLVLILASAPPILAAQEAAQPGTPPITAPGLPREVAGFRLSETSIYTDSLLGTHYRFVDGRNLYVDVAVQASSTLQHTPASAEYIIERAVSSFKGLPQTTPGGLASFEIVLDSAHARPLGPRMVPGHVVAADVRRGASVRYEAWYVYHLGPRYVRVMVTSIGTSTVPPNAPAVLRQVEELVQSILPAVASAYRL